jgi:hypothetical protein
MRPNFQEGVSLTDRFFCASTSVYSAVCSAEPRSHSTPAPAPGTAVPEVVRSGAAHRSARMLCQVLG